MRLKVKTQVSSLQEAVTFTVQHNILCLARHRGHSFTLHGIIFKNVRLDVMRSCVQNNKSAFLLKFLQY